MLPVLNLFFHEINTCYTSAFVDVIILNVTFRINKNSLSIVTKLYVEVTCVLSSLVLEVLSNYIYLGVLKFSL